MHARIRDDVIFAAAGILAGVAFGLYGGLPMLAMIGSMAGGGVGAGWVLHLMIAAFIGAVYGEVRGFLAVAPRIQPMLGVSYGVVWWVLGPLVMMPLMLGMPGMVLRVEPAIGSLWGHIIYGAILQAVGLTMLTFLARERDSRAAQSRTVAH